MDIVSGALAAQFLKLRCRDTVSDEEEAALMAACSGLVRYDAGKIIVHARTPQKCSNLLLDGLIARHITLPDGRRQIVALHVPGDFVDLHSFLLHELEHDVEALTPVHVAWFPHDRLRDITENHPHLARLLWLSTLMDAAIHREWVLSVGRRTARERVAHLFCELFERMKVVQRTAGTSFPFAVGQAELADACGLTTVHVNRTLRSLREDGLVDFRGGRVTITDYPGLCRAAGFDPHYLNLGSNPR